MPNRKFRLSRRREEKKGNRRVWAFSIALFAIAFIVGYFFRAQWNRLYDDQNSEVLKTEMVNIAGDLNKKFTYLNVSLVDSPQVHIVNASGKRDESEVLVGQYIISVRDEYVGKVSIFDAEKYVMSPFGDPARTRDADEICTTIGTLLEKDDQVLKALQDLDLKGHVSLTLWGVVDVGVEFSPPQVLLVEIAAALRRILMLKAKRIEVFVQGYADGQRKPWTEKLLDSPYYYDTVSVYKPYEPDRLSWIEFVREEEQLPIRDHYDNDDLPDLRARFVKEEFIDRQLRNCKNKTDAEAHILKGQSDKTNAIHPEDRKVKIFVNIY